MRSNKPIINERTIPSLQEWLHFFETQFVLFTQETNEPANRHVDSYERKHFLQKITNIYYRRLVLRRPHDQILQSLYVIHAGITTLKKLDDYIDTPGTSEDAAYVYGDVKEIIRESEKALATLKKETLSTQYDPLLHESIERFDLLLAVRKEHHYQCLLLYRKLWTELLRREEWLISQEVKLANEVIGVASSLRPAKRERNISVPIALMHLAFLRGDDERALQLATQLQTGYVNMLFYPIEIAYEENELELMLAWLHVSRKELTPFLQASGQFQLKRDYCDFLLHYYSLYAELRDAPDVYEKSLQQLLPYSYYEYNDHLFHNENYSKWAELQLLVGFQPEIHASAHLQKVEETDREALLPLYHQAVEKAISERNRTAYRLAVVRMKKLRAHYYELNKESLWDNYVTVVTEKYRRLRAFQDELRKGKLVHD